MYWYLEEYKDRPLATLKRIQASMNDGSFAKLKQEEQQEIADQLDNWMVAQGKNYYHPNPKEYKYYLQPHHNKAISGGNRSGKTCTCVIDVVMQIEGWHPLQKRNLERLAEEAWEGWVREWCQKLLLEKKWIPSPPIQARCIAVDYPNYVEKIIGPEYEKWTSKDLIHSSDYDNQTKRNMVWKDGSFVEFLTQEQKLKAHGGAARHVIQIDEEIAQEYWVENSMRLISVDGRIIYGATAVEGITWTEEAIFELAERGNPDIYMMEMSSYDNPMNTQRVIDRILKQCIDETDVDIRIHGKRKRRGGRVYRMARDGFPWIVNRFDVPQKSGCLILAIDPHPQIEHAGLWIWIDYKGEFHVLIDGKPNLYEVAEFFEHGTVPEMRFFINMQENMLGRKHDFCLLDPLGWQGDQVRPEERPIYEQLQDLGVYPEKGSKDRTANILKVGELLTLDHNELKMDEYMRKKHNPDVILKEFPDAHPRLMTFDDLTRTRYERRNWHYPTYRGAAVAEHNKIKPKPVDKDDHMMENEGRIASYLIEHESEIIELSENPLEEIKKKKVHYASDGTVLNVNFEKEKEMIEVLFQNAEDG